MIEDFDLIGTRRDIRLMTAASSNASAPNLSVSRVRGDARLSAAIVDLTDPIGKGVRVTFTGSTPTNAVTAVFEIVARVVCTHDPTKTREHRARFTVTKRGTTSSGNRPPRLSGWSTAAMSLATGARDTRSGTASDPDGDAVTVNASSSNTGVATVSIAQGTLPGQWIATVSGLSAGSATITVTPNDGTVDGTPITFTVTVTGAPVPCPGTPTVAISGSGLIRTLTASLTNNPSGTVLDTQYRLQGASGWTTGSQINGSAGESYQYRARARKTGCSTTYSSVGLFTFEGSTDPCDGLTVRVSLDGSNTIERDQGDSALERGVTVDRLSSNAIAGDPTVSRDSGSSDITAEMNDDDTAVIISVPSSGVTSRITTHFILSVTARCRTDSSRTVPDTDRFTVHCDPPDDPCDRVGSPSNLDLRVLGNLVAAGNTATLNASADAGSGSDSTRVSAEVTSGADKVRVSGAQTANGDDIDLDFTLTPLAEGAATIRVTFTPRTGSASCAASAVSMDINVSVAAEPNPCEGAGVDLSPRSATAELRWTASSPPSVAEVYFTMASRGPAVLQNPTAQESDANVSVSIRQSLMPQLGTHVLVISPVGTPSSNKTVLVTVTARATCGGENHLLAASVSVSVVAPPANSPPTITPATIGSASSRIEFLEGQRRTYTLAINDPDGTVGVDDLGVRNAGPFSVEFSENEFIPGSISMEVTANSNAGNRTGTFYVRVTDDEGAYDELVFYWETMEPPNNPPTWRGPALQVVPALVGDPNRPPGTPATYQVNFASWFSDPGDTLTYTGPSFTLIGATWRYSSSGSVLTFLRTPAGGSSITLSFSARDTANQLVSGRVRFETESGGLP